MLGVVCLLFGSDEGRAEAPRQTSKDPREDFPHFARAVKKLHSTRHAPPGAPFLLVPEKALIPVNDEPGNGRHGRFLGDFGGQSRPRSGSRQGLVGCCARSLL